jgi:ubiquinone/menaquinone biosynthesis C-methylase UbiE
MACSGHRRSERTEDRGHKSETVSISDKIVSQCRKPTGGWGRFALRRMNSWHSKLTDWGLGQISVPTNGTILDIGCGGGRTIAKLAKLAPDARILGIDYSDDSVAIARKTNARLINAGKIDIQHGSVSQLPFENDTFDLITAVETHFFWPDLANDFREVMRVLKTGGTFIIIAEVYKGGTKMAGKLAEKYIHHSGMLLLTPDEHRDYLVNAGFADVRINTRPEKGWICAAGRKS